MNVIRSEAVQIKEISIYPSSSLLNIFNLRLSLMQLVFSIFSDATRLDILLKLNF